VSTIISISKNWQKINRESETFDGQKEFLEDKASNQKRHCLKWNFIAPQEDKKASKILL